MSTVAAIFWEVVLEWQNLEARNEHIELVQREHKRRIVEPLIVKQSLELLNKNIKEWKSDHDGGG